MWLNYVLLWRRYWSKLSWFRFQNYRPRKPWQSFRNTLYFEAFYCNCAHLFTLTAYSPCTPYKYKYLNLYEIWGSHKVSGKNPIF
jgi:hypothetical protein